MGKKEATWKKVETGIYELQGDVKDIGISPETIRDIHEMAPQELDLPGQALVMMALGTCIGRVMKMTLAEFNFARIFYF
ncbi:MAG: hypothetical protein WC514_01580 [Candidatus Paceibacterota bacterium]